MAIGLRERPKERAFLIPGQADKRRQASCFEGLASVDKTSGLLGRCLIMVENRLGQTHRHSACRHKHSAPRCFAVLDGLIYR